MKRSPILLILLLGFWLRVFQLGQNSFWNDEAGVALAAVQPTIVGAFKILLAHAIAMPLDYLIAWGLAKLGVQEFFLRFPEAVWGTLTLAVCYPLFQRLARSDHARWAVFLLALSPLHVRYSQELRFYAPLIFFYCLATYLLLRATDHPGWRAWALFTIVAMVGIYFHVYVALVVANGAVWLVLAKLRGDYKPLSFRYFRNAVSILFAGFFLAYLVFGSWQTFTNPLLEWEKSFMTFVGVGLGWITPPYSQAAEYLWGGLSLTFGLVGIAVTLQRPLSRVAGLLYSSALQIGLIVLADWAKHYWIASRQLLHLHPTAMLFTGVGLCALGNWLEALHVLDRQSLKAGVSSLAHASKAVLLASLVLVSVPALTGYYRWPKSASRDISRVVLLNWMPDDVILIFPGYDVLEYYFYLPQMAEADITPALAPTDWAGISKWVSRTESGSEVRKLLLISGQSLSKTELAELSALGFEPLPENGNPAWSGVSLFIWRNRKNVNCTPGFPVSPPLRARGGIIRGTRCPCVSACSSRMGRG